MWVSFVLGINPYCNNADDFKPLIVVKNHIQYF
jgi:hypothetical protein